MITIPLQSCPQAKLAAFAELAVEFVRPGTVKRRLAGGLTTVSNMLAQVIQCLGARSAERLFSRIVHVLAQKQARALALVG